jgi:membrane fusion protein, multidrug efflux system
MEPLEKKPHLSRKKTLILVTIGLLVVGGFLFLYWLLWARFEEYTDDAYVSGNLLYVTPQVSAAITKVYVDDTQFVEKDHLLLELDPTDFLLLLEENKQNLAQTVRDVSQLFMQTKQKKAFCLAAKAEFLKAVEDFERRNALVVSGSVSQEDFTHAERALQNTYFTFISAEQEYFSFLAQTENTTIAEHPRVLFAKEKCKNALIALKRCKIYAPSSGIVAMRTGQVGQKAKVPEPLLAIIPLDQMWIDANFREDQIGHMQIGQKAKVTTDTYGRSCVFRGVVAGIGGGTGSVFSILPPQNATGNWIKIVQRVPVRIQIIPQECIEHPLRLGLSAEIRVDVHSIDGSSIPSPAAPSALYETDIFDGEEEGAEEMIEKIILENLPSFSLQQEDL